MAYDESVAERIRDLLETHKGISEKKMFGGIAFMQDGNMLCGVVGELLMLRLGAEEAASALTEPHTAKMDFTGRPLKGFIYVKPDGFDTAASLTRWLDRARRFVGTLPPK